MTHNTQTNNTLESVASARALYYDFFAGLFLYELLCVREDVILKQVMILKENVLDERDSAYFEILENEIKANGLKRIIDEYTNTFILPFSVPSEKESAPKRRGKGEVFYSNPQIMLYLSHYTEGCLNGKALLQARALIKQSTFRLNNLTFKESEEHLGFLLLLMRYLLCSADKQDVALSAQFAKEFVIPLGNFVIDALLERQGLMYYAPVAYVLQSFLDVERGLVGYDK
ncbi:molecular chaperone TorD family protein [Helicobacter typhlonius]|uniref:molecular chaperone TorD family protein n=1 Tax=Helicobacter typhlonius TaxID=76936 RepID=UPI002FE121A4